MFCKKCGKKLEDGSSFCHLCGARQFNPARKDDAVRPRADNKCPQCGALLHPSQERHRLFCPYCGYEINP